MAQFDNYPVVKRQVIHVIQTSGTVKTVIPSVRKWLGVKTNDKLCEYVLLVDVMSDPQLITHDVNVFILYGSLRIGYELSDIGLNHRVPHVSFPLHPLLGGQLMLDDVTWSTGSINFFVSVSAVRIPQSIPAAP